MTTRNPIVFIPGGNPNFQELPAGDVLAGAAQGAVGMTWQGAWNSGTSYIVDDAVSNSGSAYICIAANTNQAPPNATYWNLLASKGDTGATGATGPTGPAGSSDLVLISEVITAAAATTVHFATIAQTYRHLLLWWTAKDTGTGGAAEGFIKLNSDGTAANYTTVVFGGSASGTTTVTGTNGPKCLLIPGSTSGTTVGSGCLTLRNYTNTTFRKTISVDHEDNTSIKRVSATTWASTSAITDILITCPITSFVTGSIFQLYGMT